MTRYNAANNWVTHIDMLGGLGGSVEDTTMTVSYIMHHPTVPFKLTIGAEIVNVTAVSSYDFTIERGQESTSVISHDDGAKAENRPTAGVWNNLWSEVENKVNPDGTYADLRAQATTKEDVGLSNVTDHAQLQKAGDTLTGNLDFDSNEAQNAKIVNADIQSYVEPPVTSTGTGSVTLNLNNGSLFEHTVNSNNGVTFSLSNVALGKSFTLVVHQHLDGPTITLNWTILWSGDAVPDVVDDETSVFTFVRIADGTGTWLGHKVGDTYGDGAA